MAKFLFQHPDGRAPIELDEDDVELAGLVLQELKKKTYVIARLRHHSDWTFTYSYATCLIEAFIEKRSKERNDI